MGKTARENTEEWKDLAEACSFALRRFEQWRDQGRISDEQLHTARTRYERLQEEATRGEAVGAAMPYETGLPRGRANESAAARSLRYWTFLRIEVLSLHRKGQLRLSQQHDLIAEIEERQFALERRLDPDELPEVLAADDVPDVPPQAAPLPPRRQPPPLPPPRRPLLEVLLDPRNIQYLLAFGGALMVVGVVILLYVNDFFTPPTIAVGLGVINAAVLLGGWWLIRATRYQIAGRGLTLLACLVMPLNLWYYQANELLTLEGQLWVAGVVISGLYFVSAVVLRDELFVYVFAAGSAMAGLLILASLPPSPQKFWEIAAPATLLVLAGVAAIHLERAFPVGEDGPFTRRRFGLAFFWSGHALLAGGLLLMLGAFVAGDWLYKALPAVKALYDQQKANPSPIVTNELNWLAIVLLAVATYAYVYSDLVVRQIGAYVHVAAVTLLWALVVVVERFHIGLGLEAIMMVMAATALVINLFQALLVGESRYTRAFPVVGVLLPLAAVVLGVFVYLGHVSGDLQSAWKDTPPTWNYIAALVLTAASCRVGAHLYRHSEPALAAIYHFATAAATLTGAATLLAVVGLTGWQQHGPILMLLPIVYLVAAALYRDRPEAAPLVWVAHAATAVMLVSSLTTAVDGFVALREKHNPLHLSLALFFAEACVFYALTARLRGQVAGVPLAAAMACAAVWQLFNYQELPAELYTLVFAVVGLGMLLAYRLALAERLGGDPMAQVAFTAGNALLSLSFAAYALMVLSQLVALEARGFSPDEAPEGAYGALGIGLTLLSLVAIALVRQSSLRRWYVVTTIGLAAITFLYVTVLSTWLTFGQKLEVFCIGVGLLLLAAGHIGWYREQERESDLVTFALLIGSLLVGGALTIATLVDRSSFKDRFIWWNEMGFLASGVLLLSTGFVFRIKSTTIVGTLVTAIYFLTLLLFVRWERLNTIAVLLTVGGGSLFGLGLILSLYRDRLLTLPERIRKREGMFRVLSWR